MADNNSHSTVIRLERYLVRMTEPYRVFVVVDGDYGQRLAALVTMGPNIHRRPVRIKHPQILREPRNAGKRGELSVTTRYRFDSWTQILEGRAQKDSRLSRSGRLQCLADSHLGIGMYQFDDADALFDTHSVSANRTLFASVLDAAKALF
jgi:hypothetical protein